MSKSILLADDSAVARRAIRNLVTEMLGNTITYAEAAGGVEALDKAIVSQPDVVVVDIAMPEMNGVEVARHISQHCRLLPQRHVWCRCWPSATSR